MITPHLELKTARCIIKIMYKFNLWICYFYKCSCRQALIHEWFLLYHKIWKTLVFIWIVRYMILTMLLFWSVCFGSLQWQFDISEPIFKNIFRRTNFSGRDNLNFFLDRHEFSDAKVQTFNSQLKNDETKTSEHFSKYTLVASPHVTFDNYRKSTPGNSAEVCEHNRMYWVKKHFSVSSDI